MPLTPSTNHPRPTPREELVMEIMLLLDQAIEGDESVSSYELADEIVDLVEPHREALG